MTTRIRNRFALSQIASVAMAETRLAGQTIPNVLRYLAPIVAWTVASIALGIVLGLSAVILPPMGAFGIVAVAGVVLLWVMPDLPLVSPGFIRKAFFFMLIADLIIPFYYTVQISGLPWISARRVATFALIVPFLVAVAASSEVRRHIAERARASLLLFICAAGFLAVATLSVFTSISPSESTSALVDAILSWYVPFFAMIYIAKDKNDVIFLLKIICFCAIFNTGAGVVEFFLKHRFFIDIFPKGMLATMIESNPTLANLLPNPGDFRNGLFRAASTFVTALSFGEFQIIVIPIGLFFLLHRETLFERLLGAAVAFGGIVGIFCSGSRGGFVGVIASVAVFVTFYSIRKAVSSKGSLVPAISGLFGIIGFGCVIGLSNSPTAFTIWCSAAPPRRAARTRDTCSGLRGRHSSSQIRSPATVSGWEVSLLGWARSIATSCRSSSRRGSPDLSFLSGCSCFRSGMAYGIISPTCRNPARWPAHWLVALSDSS